MSAPNLRLGAALVAIVHLLAPPAAADEFPRATDADGCVNYVAPPTAADDGLSVQARRTTRDADGALIMEGDIDIREGERRLRARRAEMRDDRIRLQGDVSIEQPRLLLRAEAATAHRRRESDAAGADSLDDAKFALPGTAAHGDARRLQLRDRRLRIDDGRLFFCPPGRLTPSLDADRITLDIRTYTGFARGVNLRLGEVPLLRLPIVPLNLDDRRRSGLLAPTLTAGADGLEWRQPLYLNLAPNYDMTLSGHYYEKRGTMAEMEFRGRGAHSHWQLDAAHMNRDRQAERDRRRGLAPVSTSGERWLYALQHSGRIGRWRSKIDFGKLSDDEYERDFTPNIVSGRPSYLNQRASLNWNHRQWDLGAEIRQYQPLRGAMPLHKQRPRLHLRRKAQAAPFKLDYLLDVEYTDFAAASSATALTGERLFAEAGLIWRGVWGPLRLSPWLGFRRLRQDLDRAFGGKRRDNRGRSVGVDADLQFKRRWGDGLQILRVEMLYLNHDADERDAPAIFDTETLEFTPEQPFRRSVFSGRDRIDDTHQLGLGVETELLDADGRRRFSAGLSQIFNFREHPLFGVADSPLVASLRWRPDERWSLNGEWVHDSADNRLISGLLDAHHRDAAGWASLGWRRVRAATSDLEPVDQLRLRFNRALNPRWRLLADWRRNLDADADIDAEFGVQYLGCCWRLDLRFRRNLQNENTLDDSVSLRLRLGRDLGL